MRTGPERYRPAMAVDNVVRVPLLPSLDTDLQGLTPHGRECWSNDMG
jgi:hypothetical protein